MLVIIVELSGFVSKFCKHTKMTVKVISQTPR